MDTQAVVLDAPKRLSVRTIGLRDRGPDDVVVDVDFSGVSTGTERLLWSGRMPAFPGMGYPLVPGYESVGRVVDAGENARRRIGETVFVPGASCFSDARGLFGGAARTIISPQSRVVAIDPSLQDRGVLLALAATARHALADWDPPELIIGHGVLGRLLARLTLLKGARAPVVWETNPLRQPGAAGYSVIHPEADDRRDYGVIFDASGDVSVLDSAVQRLRRGGEIVLVGFYDRPLSIAFPPAFAKEARFRIAAEWSPDDLIAVWSLLEMQHLQLDGLITHTRTVAEAVSAYESAFNDADCLKMVIDWRAC
ncbi:MAG: chlorophyll synthesis pathway protein BchC [Alphaproteobacteria bacterium]|nr:chlorophyll synthesis pathway protein BchC [Alphaproteobacteria bacterium]